MGKGKEEKEEEEIDLLVRPQVVAPFGFSLSLSRISKAIYSPCVAHTIPALIFFSMRTNYGRGHLERNRLASIGAKASVASPPRLDGPTGCSWLPGGKDPGEKGGASSFFFPLAPGGVSVRPSAAAVGSLIRRGGSERRGP